MKVIKNYLLLPMVSWVLIWVNTPYLAEENHLVFAAYNDLGNQDSIPYLFSQFKYDDETLNIFSTFKCLPAVAIFMTHGTTPFIPSKTPERFIAALEKRNADFQIRNGDLEYLKESHVTYRQTLSAFRALVDSLGLAVDFTKKEYIQHQGKVVSLAQKQQWQDLKEARSLLEKHFRVFRSALSMTYQTEMTLMKQYLHQPILFESLNNLRNLNNKPLPLYVFSKKRLSDKVMAAGELLGMVLVSKSDGIFSSDTPELRKAFPQFVGREGCLAVFLKEGVEGKVASHEFGHLYYLYHQWDAYINYITDKGKCYEIGGHGQGDPSGIAATMAENGEIPILNSLTTISEIIAHKNEDKKQPEVNAE